MSKYKYSNNIQFWFKRIINFFRYLSRRITRLLLRLMLVHDQSPKLAKAGFVLPTVTMVMLVVVLLTVAISLRSFERADDARNVRVNQALLSSATPALKRAYAKLENVLQKEPPTTTTPSEDDIEAVLTSDDRYTFGDEEVLEVSYGGETITTAWRFPVDTDNNGNYDSYTLYGIFLRTPDATKERNPLQARTPPQSLITSGSDVSCNLAGRVEGEWQSVNGKLKKSFFVYVATVPITDPPAGDYEKFKGTTGVSALEYQQDWERIPLTNNAVVYENDLEIAPGPAFNLNGRMMTNSNLIVSPFGNEMRLYLVSSPGSCFYDDPENSKIVVGGNLINGQMGNTTQQNPVKVDLFPGAGQNPSNQPAQINSQTQSVNVSASTDTDAAYNTQAYANTIDDLTGGDLDAAEFVKKYIRRFTFAESPNGDSKYSGNEISLSQPANDEKNKQENEAILKNAIGSTINQDLIYPTVTDINAPGTTNPTSSNNGLTYQADQPPATNPDTIVDEKEDELGDRILIGHGLPLKTWDGSDFQDKYEQTLNGVNWTTGGGARTRTSRVEELPDVGVTGRDGFWEEAAAAAPEDILEGKGGLRVVTGAGVYERRNSFLPQPLVQLSDGRLSSQYPVDYNEDGTFATDEMYPIVWPDTMPMSPGPESQVCDNQNLPPNPQTPCENWQTLSRSDWQGLYDDDNTDTNSIDSKTRQYAKGDLRMRATVVYHYAVDSGVNPDPDADPPVAGDTQTPMACVSSYFDNSDFNTDSRASNNGVVYPFPTGGIGTYQTELTTQADYVFPDGRFVNENLKKAAEKNFTNLTLAEQSSVDATICALSILDGATASEIIPNNAIQEVALLNAREVKAIEEDDTSTDLDETFTIRKRPSQNATTADAVLTSDYLLPLEERYPLEIRLTQIDLNVLRNQEVSGSFPGLTPEYLLPYSGIIYATRDDAIPDRSSTKLESPTDYKLDPSRRPNGIMLVEGKYLARNDGDNDGQNDTPLASFLDIAKEKGLILVSDLPVYIKGEFNVHDKEEFTDELTTDGQGVWTNFYDRKEEDRDNNFACREGDSRCGNDGDGWRAATVLADSVNLVSDNFRFGYRNEGDFDLRNNAGDVIVRSDVNGNAITAKEARRKNGFFTNSFVTTGLSSSTTFNIDGSTQERLQDSNYSDPGNFNNPTSGTNLFNSSYFNNFVTPVQRRINAPEYVMEMCRKFPLSLCGPADWVTGWDFNQNGYLEDNTLNEPTSAAGDINGNGIPGETGISEVDVYAAGLIGQSTAIGSPLNSQINTAPVLRTWLGAGTTAKSPLEPNPISTDIANNTNSNVYPGDQRFPRRVAFKRNPFHQLELDEIEDGSGNILGYTAKPLGIDADNVAEFSYTTPGTVPDPTDNALWFRTIDETDTTGQPDDITNDTYLQNRLPYYYFDDDGDGNQETINDFLTNPGSTEARVLLPKTAEINGVSLDEADDYSVCINNNAAGQSQNYNVESSNISGACNGSKALSKIGDANSGFIKGIQDIKPSNLMTDDDGELDDPSGDDDISGDISLPQSTDNAFGDDTWVYDIPSDTIGSNSQTVITLTGDENTVFILRRSGDLTIDTSPAPSTSVQMKLEGNVDPNNIFWVVDGGDLTINNGAGSGLDRHLLTGNFLGTGALDVRNDTRILGSRILGFTSQILSTNNTTVTAMSTQDQPLLVPVLQIHVPRRTNTGANLPATNNNNQGNDTYWMPPAQNTEFNLVVGARDIPARPGELNGSLQNLPRFLENWRNPQRSTQIFGSFIQLGRSNYATAPYVQIRDVANPPASIFPGHSNNHRVYSSGTARGRIAYQGPPARNWGFDVGLLFQVPDLFAERFTVKPTDSKPDEYFREVSGDDDWIKGLLCSETEDGGNTDHRPNGTDCTGY